MRIGIFFLLFFFSINGFAESNPSQLQAKSVDFIGGVFDRKHVKTSFKEFLEFAIKFDYDLGPIYIIDNFPMPESSKGDLMSPFYSIIFGRGGSIDFVDRPPQRYPVKKSPAWLVVTKSQELYILESLANYPKHFTADGKLDVSKIK